MGSRGFLGRNSDITVPSSEPTIEQEDPGYTEAGSTTTMHQTAQDPQALQRRIDGHPFWYHTIDVAPAVTTPGWFDLRAVVDDLPWPDLSGKRCLDVGTFDGYLAFEMERRGAAEVVAIDVEDHLLWDWPPDYRATDLPRDPGFSGPPKGDGFRLVRELTGSNVDWRPFSVYDLTPSEVGMFDVVVMGTLLIHLRDPIRALEAIRSVTSGYFMSSDQIQPFLTILHPRQPIYSLNGSGGDCQWFNFNAAGHRRLVFAAGFEILQTTKPYTVAFNVHPNPARSLQNRLRSVGVQWLTGGSVPGVLHQALLARPRL